MIAELTIGAISILSAHLVSERIERKAHPQLDHAAADRALYALAPEFAIELGYEPPPTPKPLSVEGAFLLDQMRALQNTPQMPHPAQLHMLQNGARFVEQMRIEKDRQYHDRQQQALQLGALGNGLAGMLGGYTIR